MFEEEKNVEEAVNIRIERRKKSESNQKLEHCRWPTENSVLDARARAYRHTHKPRKKTITSRSIID